MPRFVESTKRDPYRNFNFRVLLNNVEVYACRKISGLTGTVEVVKFRSGNSVSSVDELSPGRTHFEPVTLEAGLTNDTAFQDWATQLIRHEASSGLRAVEPDYRRTVEILVYDLDHNKVVKKFILHNAWCSKFTAMSELAAEANEILVEIVELQHEGFTIEQVA
ncbi:phage tail protein [Corallococcus sp. BB11-1]|uniref:phage tail protein n=1 Tax=Corallococcus sp. BB11-1 TaxID=2996783 RepID=UPI00226FAC2E|nr:phage tail protein [Corallococcus sp. BB11-1]MCY1033727.1 phage tail protein [Corallococcus sp. BB11-1]